MTSAADLSSYIAAGRAVLGIELGSTRVKAVLIGPDNASIAVGTHDWENRYVDRTWTYSLDDVWTSLRGCFASLADDVRERHGVELHRLAGLGVSAMMHGYLAFDARDELLTPFRTWRNTNTSEAAERLTVELGQNIPLRWSVAHFYQAMLDREPHVTRVAFLTTLAGYVHWCLTGERVLGIGDASGMFPIELSSGSYDPTGLATFDGLAAEAGVETSLVEVLPAIRGAGEPAGRLTGEGAGRLDPSGRLEPGVPLCPPEGDAGTGMVATNSVAPRTGNVSAGTSIFAMVVLEGELSRVRRELDLVTTPAGDLVAMVHCNNGASELDGWVGLFAEFARLLQSDSDPDSDRADVFEILLGHSLEGDPDGGGLLAYNYLSGEPITHVEDGRPLFLRAPDSTFNLANFMRSQLYTTLATLRIGMDVLQRDEGVQLDRMFAHGGLFKTRGVAQRYLAAAIDTPISVGADAAEGGAWGIAVLAAYATTGRGRHGLAEFLDREVFAGRAVELIEPTAADVAGFATYVQRFVEALPLARSVAAQR